MNDLFAGAIRSKTVWLNVCLAALSVLELSGSHLTVLFGTKVAAGIMLIGSLTNVALRAMTTQALADKAP